MASADRPLRSTPREKTVEPDLGTAPIPKERYTSGEFARREWDRMWTRVWLLAGPEADVARPGDWLTFEIGPESVIVVRDRAGALHAHYNVCLHRGNRLCDRPHPADPNRMFFDFQDFLRWPASLGPRQRPEHRRDVAGGTSLGIVLDQDLHNLPRVQAGMRSRAFQGLLLNVQERRIRHFHRTLDGYLDREPGGR